MRFPVRLSSMIAGVGLAAGIGLTTANAASASPPKPRIGQACVKYHKEGWGWLNYKEYRLAGDYRTACKYNAHQRIGPGNWYWVETVYKRSI